MFFFCFRLNKEGQSALHVASGMSIPSLVSLLIDNGANIKVKDTSGRTPLHFAAGSMYPSADIVLCLLKVNSNFLNIFFLLFYFI